MAAEAIESYNASVAFGGNEHEANTRIEAIDRASDPKG